MVRQLGEGLEESGFAVIAKVSLPEVAHVQQVRKVQGIRLDQWDFDLVAAGVHCADVIVGAKTAEAHGRMQGHGS
jgi:hypothetical protein